MAPARPERGAFRLVHSREGPFSGMFLNSIAENRGREAIRRRLPNAIFGKVGRDGPSTGQNSQREARTDRLQKFRGCERGTPVGGHPTWLRRVIVALTLICRSPSLHRGLHDEIFQGATRAASVDAASESLGDSATHRLRRRRQRSKAGKSWHSRLRPTPTGHFNPAYPPSTPVRPARWLRTATGKCVRRRAMADFTRTGW
jgi:hypothetical protein